MSAATASLRPSPVDAAPSRRVRIGELDRGVVGEVDRGAVATVGRTSVAWWVGGDDRWYVPAREASTRDQLVGGTPVVESAVRIPSGDAVGQVTVARVGGATGPSVVFDVENRSPLPVALAWVVASERPMRIVGSTVVVDGDGVLSLTRPAMGWLTGATAAEIVDALAQGVAAGPAPEGDVHGVVAALVPLPHTARAVATYEPAATAGAPDAPPLDRTTVPAVDRVVAGWTTHATSGPRIEADDERLDALLRAATCDVLLGPADATSPTDLAAHVATLARLGRIDDTAPLDELVDHVRSNGSLDDDDPVAATAAFVDALTWWWAAGGVPDEAESLLGLTAEAARWLDRRRRRDAVAALGAAATDGLRRAAAWLTVAGQSHVADAVVDHVGRLGAAPPPTATRTAAALAAARGDGLAWSSDGRRPDPRWSVRYVRAALDDIVTDRGLDLELLAGWDESAAGRSIEAHDVPTSLGLLSFGVRWHGARPALLWELTPRPDRPLPAGWRLSAPAVDPTWTTGERAGEALLAAPDAAPVSPAPDPSSTTAPSDDGGSFS